MLNLPCLFTVLTQVMFTCTHLHTHTHTHTHILIMLLFSINTAPCIIKLTHYNCSQQPVPRPQQTHTSKRLLAMYLSHWLMVYISLAAYLSVVCCCPFLGEADIALS